jgi:ABC-type multidrug transport system permease subunit
MNAASWVLFALALALAVFVSFILLVAESIWGLAQAYAAGPPFVVLLVYLVTMPLVFGALGLFRLTARRRVLAAAAILVSLVAYMFVAAGGSFDWF